MKARGLQRDGSDGSLGPRLQQQLRQRGLERAGVATGEGDGAVNRQARRRRFWSEKERQIGNWGGSVEEKGEFLTV